MTTRRTQLEIGKDIGFASAEGMFLGFIQEACSREKAAEAIAHFGLEKRELLDVDPKLFELADQLRQSPKDPKPSYYIAPKEPFDEERREYLLAFTDMLLMLYYNHAEDHIASVVASMGILRRDLLHAGADQEDIDQLDEVLASKSDSIYWGQD